MDVIEYLRAGRGGEGRGEFPGRYFPQLGKSHKYQAFHPPHSTLLCNLLYSHTDMAQTIAKRKRSDDADEEPPAKRIAHESTAKSINVSVVSDTGEWAPLLGIYGYSIALSCSLPNLMKTKS